MGSKGTKVKGRSSERRQGLEALYADLEKKFGTDAGRPLPERKVVTEIERWTSGSPAVDYVTGGGFPKGRVVEFFGNESGGKTTLALKLIGEVQKAGGTAAFIDAEHTLDKGWASQIGVDIPTLLFHSPDSGEEALGIADTMAQSGVVDCIVIDSVAALVPRAELEGDMGDAHVGLQARLMSQALRKLTGHLSRHNTTIVFINQLREKVGMNSYGPSEVTTGGKALKFYASLRLDVRRTDQIKAGETTIGHRMRVKAVKNKLAPPFRVATIPLLYAHGLTVADELIEYGPGAGLISKADGGWYSCKEGKMGRGRVEAADWLLERPELLAQFTAQLSQHFLTGEVYS